MEFSLRTVFFSLCIVTVAYSHTEFCFDNENYFFMTHGNATAIEFTLRAKTTGWVGLGISATPDMANADYVIGGVHPNGTDYVYDMHLLDGSASTRPILDTEPTSDWILDTSNESNNMTSLTLVRLLDTVDTNVGQDFDIKNETVYILWAFGTTDNLTYHGGSKRGSATINLMDHGWPGINCDTTGPGSAGAMYPISFFSLLAIFFAVRLF